MGADVAPNGRRRHFSIGEAPAGRKIGVTDGECHSPDEAFDCVSIEGMASNDPDHLFYLPVEETRERDRPMASRDLLEYRPPGRYDGADGNSVRPRFTAPGVWSNTGVRTQPSSYGPSKTFTGYSLKPIVVTPTATSQPTARHSMRSVGLLTSSVRTWPQWRRVG